MTGYAAPFAGMFSPDGANQTSQYVPAGTIVPSNGTLCPVTTGRIHAHDAVLHVYKAM